MWRGGGGDGEDLVRDAFVPAGIIAVLSVSRMAADVLCGNVHKARRAGSAGRFDALAEADVRPGKRG